MMGVLLEMKDLRDKYAVFVDRGDAGRRLASFLETRGLRSDLILAIPNGGVAVGYYVSLELGVRLAVAVVRKVTFPWTTEAGFGAVSWLGDVEVDKAALRIMSEAEYRKCLEKAKRSVEERARLFAEYLPGSLEGLEVIIVDDGLATGYTMLAAIKAVKKLGARRLVAAVPTSSLSAARLTLGHVDALVVLNLRTQYPYAVADAYKRWRDLSESEAVSMLRALREQGLA
ncbi:MAG: phosphoribosyltransferase [Thermoprotei archaeon]|nr:MAG: phosphoribosyltransferase [Thermoprotei archaeon]RLE98052.1 MAG: phosphoribosyltransferase [Thermoprotei archaeon]